jgi:hypothetical protein
MIMNSKNKYPFLLLPLLCLNLSYAGETKPKFGPEGNPLATPLYSSNEYFRNPDHRAPQFWSLISYYIPQFTGASCSVASITITLNAARTRLHLTSEDKVISESALLKSVDKDHWKERTTGNLGYRGKFGVELGLLAGLAKEAFEKNGFPQVKTETTFIKDHSPETKEKLVQVLKEFETNPDLFLIANFDQESFTNDAHAGHISPVGAYDSKNQKVLILDTDRDYFMPYWISVDTFLAGMNTSDSRSKNSTHRGFITIRVGK